MTLDEQIKKLRDDKRKMATLQRQIDAGAAKLKRQKDELAALKKEHADEEAAPVKKTK